MSAGIQPKSGFSMMWKQSVSPSQRFSSSSVHFWGKKLFEKIKSKNYSSIFKHKEPSQGSQKSKSIQTKMLINLCQIKILFSSWKSETKPPKKKSRHEKEAKKLKISLSPTKEMNNHSCYISRASQQSLQPNLSQHTYKKNCSPGLVAIWLEALEENAKQFQLLFSLPLFIFWILSPTK